MSIRKIEDYVYDFHKNCAEKQARNDFWPQTVDKALLLQGFAIVGTAFLI